MAVPTIIVNNGGRNASIGCQNGQSQRRCEMNEAPPLSEGFSSTTTPTTNICAKVVATRNHKYFTKIMAVTVLAAYVVSTASAFSHTKNQIGVTFKSRASSQLQSVSMLGKRMSFIIPAKTESSLRSSSLTRRNRMVLSAEAESSTGSSKSDQKEWKAVFLALQLYKAAYGDLKVPARFVVPSAAPWPEPAWGMKLGQKVGAIRETGLYVDKSKKRREQLEKLGFIWMLRAPTDTSIPFDQIYDALTVYRAEIKPSGPLTVPTEFSVPDAEPWPESTRGLPLGRSIKQLRSKAYLKENPGSEEKLKQIGFETDKKLSANDKRFQAVYLALERYKETYGDLLVPQPFVVPSDSAEWPEESWGLRLGARVNAIRSQGTFIKNNSERQDMLDALGFVWTPPEKETKKRGRKTLDQIDQEEKEAILEASGKSGKSMGSSSSDKNAADDDADSFLSFFDFKDNDQDNSDSDETQGQPTWGLEAGRELDRLPNNNNRDVSEQEFDEDYEAPRTLGESLGAARVRALEAGVIEDTDSKRPTKRKREPDIPWFNDDFGGYFVFEDVVEALTLYKKGYGDFSNLTSGEFVIPVRDEPEHSFDDDFDDEMPMNGIDERAMTDDEIEAEMLRLERGILSTEDVKGSTDMKELEWPEHLEGMRLGDIVKRMIDGSLEVKHLPERKAQLDAIGFDWGEDKYFLDVPFEKAMCAMYAFYMVRGDMFVPADYIMPDEDPWPRALAGYELGKAVRRIRELQNFFEAFHVEKVALLRMIDFVWFPTLALPIDPDEPEVSAEMLLLGALGHPDYHQLDEFPMGLPEKIMADGPFHVSDDPRDWWRTWHNWDYVADIWISMGTRDRALALRKSGYPRMAQEHEEKYGPGLFQQINDYLENMLAEIGDDELEQMIGKDDLETFNGVVDQYDLLIKKWDGLTHDERMDAPGMHLTDFTLYGRKGGLPAILKVFTDTFEDSERQRTDLSEKLLEIRDTLFNYLDEIADCTDMDDFEIDVLWRFRIKLYLSLALSDHFNTKAMDRQKQEATAREIDELENQLDTQLMSFGTDEEDFEEEEQSENDFEVEDFSEAINGAEFDEEEETIEEEVGI